MTTTGSQHVYASIGLTYKNTFVADILVKWGNGIPFSTAVQSIIEPEMAWNQWKSATKSKKECPYAVWSIFAPKTNGRSLSDVVAHTALVFDLDSGNVAEASLRTALEQLGWESAVYSTWSAKPDNMRWRVVLPLSRPHGTSGWGDFYSAKVKDFTAALASVTGISIKTDTSADQGNRPQILPHELPSADFGIPEKTLADIFAKMREDEHGIPAFAKAIQFGTAGSPLDHESTFILSEGARRSLSPARFAGGRWDKKEDRANGKASQGAVEPTPYVGVASIEGVSTSRLWSAMGFQHISSLCEGLDAVEVLCQKGIRGLSENESRQLTLVSAMWAQYRAGISVQEIMKTSNRICEASTKADYQYLSGQAAKFMAQLRKLEEEAKPYESAIFAALKEGTGNNKVDGEVVFGSSKRLFARILSRCEHLRSEKGGKLSQAQIAIVLGYPKSLKEKHQPGCDAVRAMLGKCERAGLLVISGDNFLRTYRLIQPK